MTDLTRLRAAVLDPLEKLGVALPDDATAALALADASTAAAADVPANGLRAGIADGTIGPDNIADRLREAALDVAAHQGAVTLRTQLLPYLASAVQTALAADADRIVDDLRPTFDQAVETVANAAGHLRPNAKPADILTAGPASAAAYHAIAEQQAILELILQARIGGGRPDAPAALFIEPVPNLGHLRRAGRAYQQTAGPGGRWLAMVADGCTLRLNTSREAREVVAQARAGTRREEEARHASPPRPPSLSVSR